MSDHAKGVTGKIAMIVMVPAALLIPWWRPEKYAGSYKAIVNVVKSQIKGFEVVEQFL